MSFRDILRMLFGGERPKPPAPPPPPPPPPPPVSPPTLPPPGMDMAVILLRLHNATRDAYDHGALALDTKLCLAAQGHADWMAQNSTLSHTGRGGSSLADRVTDVGYRWRGLGENIAAGQKTPEEAIRSWMGSSGHKANILGNYTHIGIGIARDSRGRMWWCVDFGRPVPSTFSLVVEEPEVNCAGGIWAEQEARTA